MSSSQAGWQIKTSSEEVNAGAGETKITYPFLVHSQESLSQQAPPHVDNQRLARQKRRRTSPEDHAILEAEYERNPKPDKSARLQIVRKVALGEKEVQIWFQNRRQVARRKSRPLLPHEILANLQSSSQSSGHIPSSSNPIVQSSQQTQLSSQSSAATCPSQLSDVDIAISSQPSQVVCIQGQVRSGQDSSFETSTNLKLSVTEFSQEADAEVQKAAFNDARCRIRTVRKGGLSRSMSQTVPKTRRPEFPGIRRSASFIIHDNGDHADHTSVSASTPKDMEQDLGMKDTEVSSQSLSRTSSLVRLSMSIDGKAQVTTSTGTTPSPPRPHPAPFSNPSRGPDIGLRRSLSAIEPGKQNNPSSFPNPTHRHHVTGRSRDARTWEFYCDKDTRDALTEQAEREESGSAIAVIALIKSNSNVNKATRISSKKRNAHTQKPEAAKKLKAGGQMTMTQKPKLGRSQSSLDVMPAASESTRSVEVKAGVSHSKSGPQYTTFEIIEGDSDKENWVPGTQQRSPPRRRPTGPINSRRILEESSRHSDLGALMSQERNVPSGLSSMESTSSFASDEKENGAPEMDYDVTPREPDDLDCVQNLLSLSQATWQ